jgi:ubiquinone/menaquinone biosynthesis C-methylase UbiE
MEYYNKIAPSYNRLHASEQLEKARIIRNALKPRGLLLDVGAGTGIATAEFKECECIALEPSIEMLSQFSGTAVCGKAEQLPFKSRSFDCVVSITALHHADLHSALNEINRVLKEGGSLGLSFFKRAASSPLAQTLFSAFHRIDEKFDAIFLKK